MNLYFLVEGRRTEMRVYPAWLSCLVPEFERVRSVQDVQHNHYYLFSGEGFPSLLDNHLRNCIEEVNEARCFDYLVICLDADERSIEDSAQMVLNFIKTEKLNLTDRTCLQIIVQNRCLETWFLGNKKIFKKNPADDCLRAWVSHYNVKENDPEYMQKPNDFCGSVSMFHSAYFQQLLFEKAKISYSKNNPKEVIKEHFLLALQKRYGQTGHLASFGEFLAFCQTIRTRLLLSKYPPPPHLCSFLNNS